MTLTERQQQVIDCTFLQLLRDLGLTGIPNDFSITGGGGGSVTGGTGWIIVNDVQVAGGSVSNKVYQDAGDTVLQSCTVSSSAVSVLVRASSPLITIGGNQSTLTRDVSGGYYSGTVSTTVPDTSIIAVGLIDPDGSAGAAITITATVAAPPTILTLAFSGAYPGSQTELKAGDTFQIVGTTDKPAVGLSVLDFGAATASIVTFGSTTSFTATVTIANRGTTPQSLTARVQARDTSGAYGATNDTSNTVVLNNLHPTLTLGTITYPATQSALKNSETATVVASTANLDSISFTSPNGDLSITAPSTIGTPKTVTRIAGSYNVSVANFQGVATRNANAATTTASLTVAIANVAPTIAIGVPFARLRSGGNDGTSVQGYAVTVTSNQNLASAPSLVAPAGTLTGGGFAGGPSVWTRNININDTDTKGSYNFSTLVAVGLSGLTQNTIGSGAAYVLGGFVQRNLTFAAFSQNTTLHVGVVTYAKLQAVLFTATNQTPLLNASQGNHGNIANTFTVDSLGNVGNINLYWNDATAASSNSSGTAQIQGVEEVV